MAIALASPAARRGKITKKVASTALPVSSSSAIIIRATLATPGRATRLRILPSAFRRRQHEYLYAAGEPQHAPSRDIRQSGIADSSRSMQRTMRSEHSSTLSMTTLRGGGRMVGWALAACGNTGAQNICW